MSGREESRRGGAMYRRETLGLVGSIAAAGVAGCSGESGTADPSDPDTATTADDAKPSTPGLDDRPAGVYYPTHVDGMEMVGMDGANEYRCALAYTLPHRFWLVTGTRRREVTVDPADAVHLMPVVWDAETGIVPPDLNPQITIGRDGETVASLSPWPMLSQPMGFHFGDNVALAGAGTYDVEITVGQPSARRTGSLAERADGATFSFEFEFDPSVLEEIMVRAVPADQQGTRGAVEPMSMEMLPSTQVPAEPDLPGEVRATGESGDGLFVVTVLDDATLVGGEETQQYLAVSARTPYNRYPLTHASLSATLKRDRETVYDDVLTEAIDPNLYPHYGAVVESVEAGDSLTITVDAPPQTARHVGYETAFFEMPDVSLTL